MTKRNKKVNYEDVYEELARQNKARSPDESLFDTILNSEVSQPLGLHPRSQVGSLQS